MATIIQGLQTAQLSYVCKEQPPLTPHVRRNGLGKVLVLNNTGRRSNNADGTTVMCGARSSSGLCLRFLHGRTVHRSVSVHGYGNRRCGEFPFPSSVMCCLRSTQVEQIEEVQFDKNPSTSSSSAESSSDENSRERQGLAVRRGLSALDAYFDKLHGSSSTTVNGASSASSSLRNGDVTISGRSEMVTVLLPSQDSSRQTSHASGSEAANTVAIKTDPEKEAKVPQGLRALDAYFNKLRPPKAKAVVPEKAETESKVEAPQAPGIDTTTEAREVDKDEDEVLDYRQLLEELEAALEKGVEPRNLPPHMSQDPIWQGGNSYSYVVNTLVAVNLAVFLFGLASPHGVPGMGDASLPYLYGAKVNELIVDGEWWRLLTPMFLHSSLVHIGLSTWALLSYGPGVESVYGSIGFGMIYLIGGLFGNLLSFFHTPEGTVGGTGPVFALMGTWLVYVLRNREIIGLELADDMIRKLAITTAITVALCNSFPIDDWTHLGAGVVGIIFGFFTCPTVHVNVHLEETASESKNDNDDAMDSYLLLNETLPLFRLVAVFALCLALFFCLYSLGVPIATEFHFLHSAISDENW